MVCSNLFTFLSPRIGREAILKVHVSKKEIPLGDDVDLSDIASMTTLYIGEDIANLVDEAALLPDKRGKVVGKIVLVPAVEQSKWSSIEKPKSVRRYEKGENKENEVKVFDEEKGVSKATSKDDFVHQCLMGGMPMKIQKEKNVNYASDHSEGLSLDVVDSMEVENSEASIHGISQPDCSYPNSEQSRKFIGDISESDTKFQEHRDDVPQEETNKAVHCTDNDQGNHMDLGTSEIERNRRLESLITKRRLRKLLSMDPRRNHIYLYSHNSQAQDRAVVDIELQPGSAPSVLMPTRNPFDLPYDSSEEKPILTGGSFMDEFFYSQQKDISFCRHASFVRRHGFMGDLNEFPLSFPGLLTKPITSEGPGLYGFRRPSDMERNEQLFTRMLSQQAELNQIQSVSYHQASTLPPEEEKQRKLVELDFSHEETKDEELDSILDLNVQAATHTTDEAVMKLDIVGETYDETSSQSSSEASEDIIYADKNEAFRNSVRKVLTCLTQKNKGLASEKIGLPNNPLYGTSPTAIHPTNMEEHSLYMGRPFHTPTYSIASDMHVNVSEAGSPSFNAEANSPTDKESFVYYGDVDKDISSDDEDFWGASSHPVGFEEFGSRLRVDETWEMGKSLLGLPTHTSYDPPNSSGKLANVVEQAIHDASSTSPRSMLQKERCLELMDFVHKIDNLDDLVPLMPCHERGG
ncbi:hypothetical protein Nepgr_000155 [Nepenthes gracilis]|uniref:Uncharacterized protein n=1 Tax=Nepenthes gracilis TaxID=150966 RepID=A0AAD3P2Q4_NEPGR|nr:hypothetical protein Nepgr_000155 [Nepenthes gracilis]